LEPWRLLRGICLEIGDFSHSKVQGSSGCGRGL
jgi:hypothetical protein